MTQEIKDVLKGVPSYQRFLSLRHIDRLVSEVSSMPGVQRREIGETVEGDPLEVLEIGSGERTALLIGVPHSDEPLGSLVTTYFARWLARHRDEGSFGWRWLMVPVLERRGMRLNERWFHMPHSLAMMAKAYFREPTEDQYEWTFPIEYKDYQWSKSRPETLSIKRLLEEERPELLCGLHHCGFSNAYFYLSQDMPAIYPKLRKLAGSLRISLSDHSPDVPFGTSFSPGFYKMYGLRDYIDYYSKSDPAQLASVRRGACSDEWYQDEIGGFSFNCEVPMYLSPKSRDRTPTKRPLKNVLEGRHKRGKARVAYSSNLLKKLGQFKDLADPVLFEVAQKHVANAEAALGHDKKVIDMAEDRPATEAEAFENGVLSDLFDLFFLGQMWRVAEDICLIGELPKACQLMDRTDLEINAIARNVETSGGFYHIPIAKSVKLQLGSVLLFAEELARGQPK